MRDVHAHLRAWMDALGMAVRVDEAGNLRGETGVDAERARLIIGSHLDTVPRRGRVRRRARRGRSASRSCELLAGRALPVEIEVVGFSEEEGVRFGVPFIGSRALVGDVDDDAPDRRDAHGVIGRGTPSATYGLDPHAHRRRAARRRRARRTSSSTSSRGRCSTLGLPLGVVDAIAGQSRVESTFTGRANHAGTTPMDARRDALAGAAEWIAAVEQHARGHARPRRDRRPIAGAAQRQQRHQRAASSPASTCGTQTMPCARQAVGGMLAPRRRSRRGAGSDSRRRAAARSGRRARWTPRSRPTLARAVAATGCPCIA